MVRILKTFYGFKYLGSYIQSTEKYINIRIAICWEALIEMNTVCISRLPAKMKRNFFRVTVKSVLIYGSVIWILTKALENRFNGNCT